MKDLEAMFARIDAAFDEVIGQVRQETEITLDAIRHLPAQERITKEETPCN